MKITYNFFLYMKSREIKIEVIQKEEDKYC